MSRAWLRGRWCASACVGGPQGEMRPVACGRCGGPSRDDLLQCFRAATATPGCKTHLLNFL